MKKSIKRGYVTEKEAAKLLGKSQKWLQNDRYKRKTVPFIRYDGRILYKKDDVVNFRDRPTHKLIMEGPGIIRPEFGQLPFPKFSVPTPKVSIERKLLDIRSDTDMCRRYLEVLFEEHKRQTEWREKSWLGRLFNL